MNVSSGAPVVEGSSVQSSGSEESLMPCWFSLYAVVVHHGRCYIRMCACVRLCVCVCLRVCVCVCAHTHTRTRSHIHIHIHIHIFIDKDIEIHT
jgi:hypothetical protein